MKTMIKTGALVVAGLAVAQPASAQFGASLQGAGMAGAYVGLARGHEALHWNPANLALAGGPTWSVQLPNLFANAGIVGPDAADLKYFGTTDPTDAQRAELLGKINGQMELGGSVELPLIGLQVGNFAVGVKTAAVVNSSLSKELVDLFLYTKQHGDIDFNKINEYRVGNTAFRDSRHTTVQAAYGRSFGAFSVGLGGRYVMGQELQRGRVFEPEVDLDAGTFHLPVMSVRATSGTGYGLDAGVAFQPRAGLTLSASVENVVQQMTWDDQLELRQARFSSDEIGDLTATELTDRLAARPLDGDAVDLQTYEVAKDLFNESYFPRVLKVGAGWESNSTSLGVTYAATQGKGDLHAGWPSYVALGVEQRLPLLRFLAVRGGYATGSGASAITGGLSMDLGPVSLIGSAASVSGSAETAEFGAFTPTHRFSARSAAGTGFSLGLGIEIRGGKR